MNVERNRLVKQVKASLKVSPVVALEGARQVGKTTMARMLSERRKAHYFDLERNSDRVALKEPELVLSGLMGSCNR